MKLTQRATGKLGPMQSVELTERAGQLVREPNQIREWTFAIDDNDIALFTLDQKALDMLAAIRAQVADPDGQTPVASRLLELAFHARMVELGHGPGKLMISKAGKLVAVEPVAQPMRTVEPKMIAGTPAENAGATQSVPFCLRCNHLVERGQIVAVERAENGPSSYRRLVSCHGHTELAMVEVGCIFPLTAFDPLRVKYEGEF